MKRQLTKLTAFILVPVLLLAVIAVIGLIEYRHAVTEDARVLAEQWTTRADRMYEDLVRQTEPINETILFSDVPAEGTSDSAGVERLERAAEAKDEEALLGLIQSKEMTPSGLPIRALAAWRLYELTGDENLVVGSKNWSTPKPSQFLSVGTAVYLKDVFIHESPSAISAPIIEAVAKRSEFAWQWRNEWKSSERKRRILERHRGAQGFVMEPEGPALIVGRKVLLPERVRNYLKVRLSTAQYPAWMKIDYQALNESLVTSIAEPFATGGHPLKMVIGIGDHDVLYAGYWKVVWWVAAVIVCALITAIVGLRLIRRVVERERRLSELKSQFVASVSHELRTPVASMRLMADALDAGKVDGEKSREFHRLMSQESARLTSLIENVLDFARIEEGRKDYQFAEADLEKLVRDTVQLMEPVANERQVTIDCNIEELSRPSMIDSGAVQQAIINLLDNAIKFSPSGGTVSLKLEQVRDRWQLSIADEGPGVPVRDRRRIFERFYRLGDELRREVKGAGIGLSIVKHIIDAHGATISVQNGKESGAKFVIRSGSATPSPTMPEQCVS